MSTEDIFQTAISAFERLYKSIHISYLSVCDSHETKIMFIFSTMYDFDPTKVPVLVQKWVGLQPKDEALGKRADWGDQPGQHKHYPWI